MIIENFKPFVGEHCETTATGTLLNHIGIEFSEPMLFGIGEGLGFIFWKMKTMDWPFIGGRVKTDQLTKNISTNLNLQLNVTETSSTKKAWNIAKTAIDNGTVVGLKLDCYHLEYFTSKIHFAGHYAAMYGYDDNFAYLIDTDQQGGKVKTSLENLALARNEKGPMSSKNLTFTIEIKEQVRDVKEAIKTAICNNTVTYLNPPIKNLTYKGILKTSTEIIKWFENSPDVKRDFQTTAMLMERAGTGGSLFRNLYRDFLKESYPILQLDGIKEASKKFTKIASQWKTVADLFHQAGETNNISYINEASIILKELAESERLAMEQLQSTVS